MTKLSASEAKLHFGAQVDKLSPEPASGDGKKKALNFLDKWAKHPAVVDEEKTLEGDIRAQTIWDKYTLK